MAHAIGALGSPVETYRREKKAAERREQRRARLRNQERKVILAKVTHNGGQTFKVYKVREGHLHHLVAAFWWGEVSKV